MMDAQGPAEAGVVVQDIVYAGLEAMGAAIPLDLCAYLHATDDQGPQLFLGAPDLASIEPTEAFSLFTALRDALQDPHEGDETMLLGGYLAIALSTEVGSMLRAGKNPTKWIELPRFVERPRPEWLEDVDQSRIALEAEAIRR